MATGSVSPKAGKILNIPDQTVTIGTATDLGTGTTVSVAFTAGSVATGGPVNYFTATSTPGSITANGTTSPITVSGLTTGTAYTFKVKAGNATGYSSAGESAASNSVTPEAPGDYDSIATFTTTGSAQGVTFSSIPQTYKHLQLRCFVRDQASSPNPDYLLTQLNGVTTTQYVNHAIYGNGATVTADAFNISTYGFCGPLSYVSGAYSTANVWSPVVIDILDYTNTNKYTTLRGLGGFDSNGSGTVGLFSGLWKDTAAVTSVYISTANNNEASGSVYALYGIKG